MLQPDNVEGLRRRVLIRIDTLIKLRWLAIFGQTLTVVVIAFGFKFPMPWITCFALIGVSALLNAGLIWRYKSSDRLTGNRVLPLMVFDVLQLGFLLFLTGGLQNPFAILLMAPVIVSATSLRLVHTLFLGALAAAITTALVFYYVPLPWHPGENPDLPFVYVAGTWVAIVCTLTFTAVFTFRVAEEARKLADALSATELVLQREQHLTAIDGLAAAAAHELGTPLATIALVSKEMINAMPEDDSMREDAELLRSQAQRCRDILQTLTSLSSEGEGIIKQQSLASLVEETVAPLRDFGVAIQVNHKGAKQTAPETLRNPAVQYGLGNLIDNAVDFANKKVVIETNWNDEQVSLEVRDDGPGFHQEILHRLGEPFVSTRPASSGPSGNGLGLGLFIAKTLLERSGAALDFSNAGVSEESERGARVQVTWPREAFEKPPATFAAA